ncbi:MAG: 3-phosphoshikimate 1-carboxyvinyltransferase, partial [Candidatus Omnitrophica bacterium]|nr:3-phosphoshikimate 1-carboxyvinyltransferase [Candidatus Omnitrophota bacterium]
AARAFGAQINTEKCCWIVHGFGKNLKNPEKVIDLMNSGTSFNLMCGVASLGNFEVVLDGDKSLRTRPVEPLLSALKELGAEAFSINRNGRPPVKIKGPLAGGKAKVDGINSQFVSSLLISTPVAFSDTELIITNLHEIPYVMMTLKWLDSQGIKYERSEDLTYFHIKGNQKYLPFVKEMPGDWSSATFPLVAAAITESDIVVNGIDINDVQGDKKIIDYLKQFGVCVHVEKDGVRINKGDLKGQELDLNSTPDALPAMAVLGCAAEGCTRLFNVPQARIKETDRIRVMAQELLKMGADIQEVRDGLLIRKSSLKGTVVDGHKDHRVVMALVLAGLIAEGETIITTAECVSVTFPGFFKAMREIGADIKIENE